MQMFTIILLLLYFGDATVLAQEVKKPDYDDVSYKTNAFTDWLLHGHLRCGETGCPSVSSDYEYEGYDGFYNNIGRPDLGSVDTPLLRRTPAAYRDGVYEPSGFNRPAPLELSEKLLDGPVGSRSKTGKNAFLVFFGQQVVEEILDAQRAACPPEYFNLKIPKGHQYSHLHTELPVLRTRYDARTGFSPNNPRQQLNEITPYIDGGLIYGTTKAWSDVLRTYSNGKMDENGSLATSHGGLFPELNTMRLPMANPPPPANHTEYIKRHSIGRVDRFFKLGNPRGNENAYLLTFGVLWFRWHNHIARNFRRTHKDWSSEKVFNEARRWVIGTQQHIIVNEWLPAWLGEKYKLPKYTGYDPSVDPQIDQFFQAAAFRFGHTLVPPAVQTRANTTEKCALGKIVRTCNSFWRPQEIFQDIGGGDESTMGIGMEKLILGMTSQLCEEEDHRIVEDLRGQVFGPLEFSRRDLMAINIQRGRDHGLPDFNTVREFYNLTRVKSLKHFKIKNDAVRANFSELYGKDKFDDIDLWVGGIMETDTGPGELFRAIIIDQFKRIRDGDRFWYKNKQNGLFTDSEIKRIEETKFIDILLSVTNLKTSDIQENPFGVPIEDVDKDLKEACPDVFNQTIHCLNLTKEIPKNSTCFHASANVTKVKNTPCITIGTYDYFSTSDVSFILTFLGLGSFKIGLVVLLIIMLQKRQRKYLENSKTSSVKLRNSFKSTMKDMKIHTANEWTSHTKPERTVLVLLNREKKQIQIKNVLGQVIRALDLTHNPLTKIFITTDNHYVLIRVEHNYDLVLRFASDYMRNQFVTDLEEFGDPIDMKNECIRSSNTAAMMKHVITRKHRKKKLEKFFRVVFAEGFEKTDSTSKKSVNKVSKVDSKVDKDVVYMELTITEFAEVLSMSAESEFVKKMFDLVDKNKNGFISFREFMDMFVIFFKGTPDEKIELMFNIYDINREGKLSRKNFADMLRSLMETVNEDLESDKLDEAIEATMKASGLAADQDSINLSEFRYILRDYKDNLSLNFNGMPDSITNKQTKAQRVVESMYGDIRELQSRVQGDNKKRQEDDINDVGVIETKGNETYWYPITKYFADKQLEIFWIFLYTTVLFSIFAERAYYYQVEREHSGLRQIAGPGVTITRGAASAIMFTYATLLVTMCQNTITTLRDTFLHIYIPFDSSLQMHKYVAFWALVFTVIHIVGHAVNFYHISTQTSDDLTCLFPNFFHATHEIPKFDYWCWQTMTGVTGIALTILAAIMFTFALPVIRRKLYDWFWFTHSMYPLFFILMILHGTGRLVQEPFSYFFLSGPVILFALDKIVTASRKTVEIQISKATLLPSGVTCLVFKKPPNFQHKSGQWVRISCTQFNKNEYHPFTISSAPNEPYLTVHIRAVGPWTREIRNRVDPAQGWKSPPTIRVDGPYGEGTQDWYKYDVGIMIGGGIGVTPFASILKDIVYKSNLNQSLGCKKIYFFWVTRTQKQFEWMVDILRELEGADEKNVVSSHIFITQFWDKFDLRTILLYICERYFQRVSNKSLFTGLRAITHFGRPDFLKFFRSIRHLNNNTNKVGVFSCGPRTMTQSVDRACHTMNRELVDTSTLFKHHYKNF